MMLSKLMIQSRVIKQLLSKYPFSNLKKPTNSISI